MRPEDRWLKDEEMEQLLGIDFATAYSGHVEEYRDIRKAQDIRTAELTRKEDIELLEKLAEVIKRSEKPNVALYGIGLAIEALKGS